MSAYSEKVMDHFQHPRNMGEIENASGVGTVGNAKCGDIMRIFLDIDDAGIIRDVKFKTFGCGAAVATSSMATELVKGKSIEDALKITNAAVMEAVLAMFTARGLDLWDIKVEWGLDEEGRPLLIDEIAPGCCRAFRAGTRDRVAGLELAEFFRRA